MAEFLTRPNPPVLASCLVESRRSDTDGGDDAMPRFYFEVEFGDVFPDEQGVGLPDVRAARNVALDTLAEMLRGAGEEFWQAGGVFRLTAQDNQRRPVFRIDVTGRSI